MSEYGRPPVHINIEKAYKDAVKAIKKELKKQDTNRCPFCGTKQNQAVEMGEYSWIIWCRKCGATGPAAKTEPDAWIVWKKRTWRKN